MLRGCSTGPPLILSDQEGASPVHAAHGVTDRLRLMEYIVGLVDDLEFARLTGNRAVAWKRARKLPHSQP
jgi:hypothetical protein